MRADSSLDQPQKLETSQVTLSRQKAQTVLALQTDLRELLDEYGPVWYSEELNDRVSAALKILADEL